MSTEQKITFKTTIQQTNINSKQKQDAIIIELERNDVFNNSKAKLQYSNYMQNCYYLNSKNSF